MYKVIDNFLPTEAFVKLKDICVNSSTFPWFLTETAYPEKGVSSNSQVSFANAMYMNTHSNDALYLSISNILATALSFRNYDMVTGLYRIRAGLQIPLPSKQKKINNPHIDINEPHKVLLLYMNDSDGDTILYNEKHDYSDIDMADYVNNNEFTVMDRVSPKGNRAVIFDGYHWHSSSTPTKSDKRVVLNCNFL